MPNAPSLSSAVRSISAVVVVVIRAIRFCRPLCAALSAFSARTTRASSSTRSMTPWPVRSGGFRSSGSAPRQHPGAHARACSSASNRVISPAARSAGRACCSRRGGRIEAAGLAPRVIEDLLLDVAERHARLGGGVGRFHTVDKVERRKTELAQRQLARFDDGTRQIIAGARSCSGSCCHRRAA